MSKIFTPPVRLTFPGLAETAEQREDRDLIRKCAEWRRAATVSNPVKSNDTIVGVLQAVVSRANDLGKTGPVSAHKIADFLLRVTMKWLLGGTPVEKIEAKLPKTLDELGMLVITEGAPDGRKLTGAELSRASRRGGQLLQ